MAFLQTTAASISSGGTINGDLTISGDLTVTGVGGGFAYTEVITGDVQINGPAGTGAGSAGVLVLSTAETTIRLTSVDQLGRIDFQAPSETGGSDAILVGASIHAVVEEDFASDNNSTALVFSTATTSAPIERMRIDQDGLVTIQNGSIALVIGADTNGATLSDNTRKYTRFGMPHYHNAEEPITFITGDSDGTDNIVAIGGMSTTTNAATQLRFYTAANDATTTGTERLRITSAGLVTMDGDIQTGKQINQLGASGEDVEIRLVTDAGAANADYWKIMHKQSNDALLFQNYGTGAFVSHMVLDANSRISLSNNDSGTNNTVFGYQAGNAIAAGTNSNVLVGYQSGLALNSGDANVLIGTSAGDALTSGSSNVAIGGAALSASTDADKVVCIGNDAMQANATDGADGTISIGAVSGYALTSGQGNIAIGFEALKTEDDGDFNTAVGYKALTDQTGVSGTVANTAVGYLAGTEITTGIKNTMIGAYAGYTSLLPDNCVLVGYNAGGSGVMTADADGTVAVGLDALSALTTGSGNIAIGANAADALTVGTDNTCIGVNALGGATTTDGIDFNVAIGNYAMAGTNAGAAQNVAVGYAALDANMTSTADNNTAVGWFASSAITSGANNTSVGSGALILTSTGSGNTAVGQAAGDALTDGLNNVFIGREAGTGTTGVDLTVCIGYNAGAADMTGGGNADGSVAIGANSLNALTSGPGNVAVGYNALAANTTGGNNLAIGTGVLQHCVDGAANIGIGSGAMDDWDVGGGTSTTVDGSVHNLMIGVDAGGGAWTNVVSAYNIGIGNYVMDAAMDGALSNTAIGYSAGTAITTGDGNTLVGMQAGDSLTTGGYNVCIGKDVVTSAVDSSGQFVIGNNTAGVADLTATFGNGANTASLGIDGSDTSWAAASSDERYKENIETSNAGLSFVNDLRPVTYNWKKAKDVQEELPLYEEGSEEPVLGYEYGETLHGFIAQEVKEAIDKHSDIKEGFKMWKLKDDGIQTVADGNLIPMLVKAVQELSAKVEALENA
jgi:hypothetical protein